MAVVSWNTRKLLAACLRSLCPEFNAKRAAVWVVDNASCDGSADMVRSLFPWVRLIEPGQNVGFGAAVNRVAGVTDSPWIAPANADVEVSPGAFGSLLDAGERDPGTGIVAPRLLMPDGRTQHSVHAFPTVTLSAIFNLGLARLVPGLGNRLCLEGYWDADRRRRVDWVHGAFLLVRREAFDAVGGFDTQQWLYAEDLDLAWRLHRAGWSTVYEPEAKVRHAVSAATERAFGEDRARRQTAAAYAWMARRRGALVTRVFAAINWFGAAGRAAALTPLARARPARWGQRYARWRAYMQVHRLGLRSTAAILRHR